ncbi:MAG: 7-cyano-7-deazaguanine synthase [Anaerolineae bacterium]|nr:7-cyano-7-deazaguanine synthase [Anaerolineae bacterium]
MTHHMIFKYSDQDEVTAVTSDGDVSVTVQLYGNADTEQYIQTNLASLEMNTGHLSVLQKELVYLAAAVYSVDRRLYRPTTAYNQWDRHIHVYFPVHDTSQWEQAQNILESAISFVSGDRWAFTFYQSDFPMDESGRSLNDEFGDISAVALLSGGLDSFIGAVDLLETYDAGIMFVSHYTSGSMEHSFQNAVVEFLDKKYPSRINHRDIFVQPYKGQTQAELTSRSRSFLYFVLGVVIAEVVGSPLFVIPENGFISLNVPLTVNRAGSLSSRTTHPYFVELFREFVQALGIGITINAPYEFKTKGEMLVEARNQTVVHEGYALTMSCSSASGQRFGGNSPKTHCGKCLPCIVRRAAILKAGLVQDTYITDVLSATDADLGSYPDLWAVKRAILRYKRNPPTIFDLFGSAVLSHDLDGYFGVFRRGLEEIAAFIEQGDVT